MKQTIEILKVKANPKRPNLVGNARRKALKRGLCYEAFVPYCGESYHATEEAAWAAARRRARKACPANPPCPSVVKLELEDSTLVAKAKGGES